VVHIETAVDHDGGGASEPVVVDVPASSCSAGVIEVEPVPCRGARLRFTVTSEADDVRIFDLFVISNG
jgi:hypothetical protein